VIHWDEKNRAAVCLSFIVGPPCLGASPVVLCRLAAHQWPTLVVFTGKDSLHTIALGVAATSATGVALLAGRWPSRIVATLMTFVAFAVACEFAYQMLVAIVERRFL
jgi:hypothetical protein